MSREIRSPVYQIDFTAVDAGKRIASTKRRIRWRFGFTNQDALAAGGTGTECRGEEHDITLIWSLTSGKRLVLADGQEVHYSNNRNHVFDFSWTMRGNHVLKVTAHANPPINAHPNFRQYDFFVDGMSFFSMPKVYRLGLTDSTPITDGGSLALAQSSRVPGSYGNYSSSAYGHRSTAGPPKKSLIAEIETPNNTEEEEAYLKEAIKASLSEVEKEKEIKVSSASSYAPEPPSSSAPDLLIDFMSEPGPVPAPAPNTTAMTSYAPFDQSQQHISPYAIHQDPFSPAAPAPTSVATAPAPMYPPQTGPGLPMAQPAPALAIDPFAAPPSTVPMQHNPMSSTSSLGSSFAPSSFAAGAPAPVPPANTPFSVPPPAPMEQPPPVPEQAPPAPSTAATPQLTMAPKDTSLGSDANDAFAKFASMDQFDLVKPKVEAENPFDASPVAPTPSATPAPATLAGMKAMNDQASEKKEVMKNTMNNSNAMVMSTAQTGNWGGYNTYGAAGMGAPAPMGQGQTMMNQGTASTNGMGQSYGYPAQQPYGAAAAATAAPSYPQYGMPQQPMPQQPPMGGMPQQPAYGQPPFQQGYGQPQQF